MPEGNILGQLLFLILVQREKIFRLIVYILEKKSPQHGEFKNIVPCSLIFQHRIHVPLVTLRAMECSHHILTELPYSYH